MLNIWFSNQVDVDRLKKEIETCPECVGIHQGDLKRTRSLRSVMDECPSIRLYLEDRKNIIIVERCGRKLKVTPTACRRFGRRRR